jgi:Ca2+-transporting ATPase
MLLVVYAGVRHASASDDMARALMFTVLVLANLGLIHANRSWRHGTWRGGGAVNATFRWIAVATLAMLALVLGIPQVSALFAFAAPTPAMLLAGAGIAVLALLWFEGVKWMLARRHAATA